MHLSLKIRIYKVIKSHQLEYGVCRYAAVREANHEYIECNFWRKKLNQTQIFHNFTYTYMQTYAI